MPILVALLSAWLLVPVANALTLDEAHRMAVKQAEGVARTEAGIEAAEAQYRASRSLILPTLSLQASELIQDSAESAGTGSVQTTLTRRTRPNVTIELTQPLFSGFREFAALSASKATQRQREWERRSAIQKIYEDVAAVFFSKLQRERELHVLRGRADVLAQRIQELKRREGLGRARAAERVSVEADRKDLEADILTLEGEDESLRQLLSFFLGQPAVTPLEEGSALLSEPAPLDIYLASAQKRPDLEALREGVKAVEHEIGVARGSWWPEVDFRARYYAYQVGYLDEIDWDLLFALNFPFFQGGRTKAEVDQAKAELRVADLTLRENERRAIADVGSRHSELRAVLKRRNALEEAHKLYERNYELQTRDYRLGQVTNLEVLSALTDLYDAKRKLEVTRMNARTLEARLKTAAGLAPEVNP